MAEYISGGNKTEVVPLRNRDISAEDQQRFQELLASQPEEIRQELQIAELCQRFARIKRGPRYYDNEPESDVEHSYMVAMICMNSAHITNQKYGLNLDVLKIGALSLVHDLLEVVAGDVITFNISDEARAAKEAAEAAAKEEVLGMLPPFLKGLFEEYEAQESLESRFVRMKEKNMPPLVDIVGQGGKLVYNQYDVSTPEELVASHQKSLEHYKRIIPEFPHLHDEYETVAGLFETQFEMELPELKKKASWKDILKRRVHKLGMSALSRLE